MTNEVAELVAKAADRIEAVEKAQGDMKQAIRRELDEMAQKMETAPDSAGVRKADPIGQMLESDGIKSFRNREQRGRVNYTFKTGLDLVLKSTVVGDTAGSSEEGYNVQPQRVAGLANDPRRRLTLLQALPKVRATGNTFEFNALDSYVNQAAYQASEGARKQETSLPTELKQVSIKTIAHWIPLSEQVLSDAPALRQQVSSLLVYGVQSKLERELILGAGSPGEIGGLTDSGNHTAFTPSTSAMNAADAIGEALAFLDASGWAAGLIIMHPDDWQAMRAERATTSNEYLVGSWSNPAAPNVWGVPVVTSPFIEAGTVIVMDPSQVAVLDRQDASIQMGWIDDQFVRNVVSMRAELRAGLAVFAPSAVLLLDI